MSHAMLMLLASKGSSQRQLERETTFSDASKSGQRRKDAVGSPPTSTCVVAILDAGKPTWGNTGGGLGPWKHRTLI